MSEEDLPRKSIEEIGQSIVQAIQAVFTATKTAVMYPAENPSVIHAVESAREAVMDLIPPGGAFDVSFMEEKIVVNGEILADAMQKRGIFHNFHEMMKNRRMSSITFRDGFTAEELRKFLVILGTRVPVSELDGEGAVYRVLEEEGIRKIEVDEQIFVAISKREKVVDARLSMDQAEDTALRSLKDNVFARFMAGEIAVGDMNPDTVQSLVADPDKMLGMVQEFIRSSGWEGTVQTVPFRIDETRAILDRLAEIITRVEDPHLRSRLDAEVAKIAAQIDNPGLTEILISSAEAGEVSQVPTQLPRVLFPLLGDQRFTGVVESMIEEYRLLASQTGDDDWPTARVNSLVTVLDDAADFADEAESRTLREMIEQAGAYRSRLDEMANISGSELARSLEAGGGMHLCDLAKGPALVAAARYLFESGEDELADGVLVKLFERFKTQSAESRMVAAQQIWGLFKRLGELGKEDHISAYVEEISEALVEGRSAVQSFADLSHSMDDIAGGMESVPGFKEEFSLEQGTVSGRTIEKLMSADTGKVVQAVFRSGDSAAQEAISKVLMGMEDRAVPALLDTVQTATDTATLESVAGTLSEMSADALPDITARFTADLQPAEAINLVRVVALIGGEEYAAALEAPLAGDMPEVRVEAVRALGRVGGKQAMQMVLNASADLDMQVKVAAIRELANFHDFMAVRRLMELVSPRKKGEVLEDSAVMIAAARSLGAMRVRQAVESLVEAAIVSRRHVVYPEEVRAAAATALGQIGGPESADALKRLLKDSSMLVKSTARKALSGA
ncbi:MAG: HEAT repeat domain-containing protein [Actinobacteria bacterium]|nr:HEAT repeat domain-containing protein [Actinomycetota bacterium]MBU2687066.1 HEAT repeat domain-containing protein [Actinomycetota bacterium]